jgi:hypothetical protein
MIYSYLNILPDVQNLMQCKKRHRSILVHRVAEIVGNTRYYITHLSYYLVQWYRIVIMILNMCYWSRTKENRTRLLKQECLKTLSNANVNLPV